FDVATTLVILKLVPMEVFGLAAPLRWLANAARPLLVGGYLRRYRRRRPLGRGKLAYYEAAACMKVLVRAGELHGASTGETTAARCRPSTRCGRRRERTGAPRRPASFRRRRTLSAPGRKASWSIEPACRRPPSRATRRWAPSLAPPM